MKEIKELKFEELTLEQKLGMVHSAVVNKWSSNGEAQIEFLLERIKNHALGAIWIPSNEKYTEDLIKQVREVADYPVLIMTDAEHGIGDYRIGLRNCTGRTGDEENAYVFGKSVGVLAKNLGYDVVCSPILDHGKDGGPRCFGKSKELVAKFAAAEARGMRDGGILAVGKHYPSPRHELEIDSHMAEAISYQTKEELIDDGIYAYKKLIDEGLLDGVMTTHHLIPKIDPKYPASLSKPIIDILKEQGFEGFYITDALDMMGIRAKFGAVESKGMAVQAGNDFVLTYSLDPIGDQKIINDCYEKGIITDERLDEAVKKVLETQHKAYEMRTTRKYDTLSEEDIERLMSIEKNAVCAHTDEGVPTAISRDGKHEFVVMVRNEMDTTGVAVDTFRSNWLFPNEIKAQLLKFFPNSIVHFISQLPTQRENHLALCYANGGKYEDVIFLTFSEEQAYIGIDYITQRTVTLMEAMQYTDKIKGLVHFGNPCVLDKLPHIPRYILGDTSKASVKACIEVLAGEYEAKGTPTYEYQLS